MSMAISVMSVLLMIYKKIMCGLWAETNVACVMAFCGGRKEEREWQNSMQCEYSKRGVSM